MEAECLHGAAAASKMVTVFMFWVEFSRDCKCNPSEEECVALCSRLPSNVVTGKPSAAGNPEE